MLPSYFKLSSLISGYIQIKLLDLKYIESSTDKQLNLEWDNSYDKNFYIEFHGYYNGSAITDGFYIVETIVNSSLNIPLNCTIRINCWFIEVINTKIVLVVLNATEQPDLVFSFLKPIKSVESDELIAEQLLLYKYVCTLKQIQVERNADQDQVFKLLKLPLYNTINYTLNLNYFKCAPPEDENEDLDVFPSFSMEFLKYAYKV